MNVGNFVFISQDEEIPCDLVIFATSNEGTCFCNTSKVDGEIDLKKFSALEENQKRFGKIETMIQELIRLDNDQLKCDHPNSNINSFKG